MEKRRLKNLIDAHPKYKYLIEAVNNLIRAYKNIEKSPFQTDDVQFNHFLQ